MPNFFSRAALCLLACAAVSTQASAAMPQTPSITVHADDLNLATDAGVAALRVRIHQAAQRVCGDYDIRDLSAVQQAAKCRQMAMDGVAPRIALAIATARDAGREAANTAQPGVGQRGPGMR